MTDLKACNFIKQRLQHRYSPGNIAKFSRTPILKNTTRRVLLNTIAWIFLQLAHAQTHCIKSVLIRSYSGPHFPAFGLNTETYEVSLCIQSKWGKMQTRITPNTDTFHVGMYTSEAYSQSSIRSLFWYVFSGILTEDREILRISPYSVRMWENTD